MERRALLGLAGAGLFGGLAAPLSALAPLVRRGNHLFVSVRVNGMALDALLDSGAQMSVLDASIANRLGLMNGGNANLRGAGGDVLRANLVKGATIVAAGVTFRPAQIVAVDLTDMGNRMIHGPIAMILGRDFFDSAVLSIDIARQFIDVVPPSAPRRGRRLPLTKAFGIETVSILIDGKPAQATFDTGNAGRLLLSEDFARRAGLLVPGRRAGLEKGQGIGSAVARPLVTLRSVEIAGRRIPVAQAAVGASAHATDATIGLDTLRHFRLVCDFAGRGIWFDPV